MEDDITRIKEVFIEDELKKSYLSYSMSVIVGRALPDVRDGLKPVHRRIFFAMNELGIVFNKPHKKSARIVGEVIGKYHPHGDLAVYDALVRLAQDFNMRYKLVDGQGNFGNIDGDSPAAMRYTEARMSKIASEILKDIDKETVDFQTNFDDTLQEPEVLPSRIPQLLINGSSGIAVGMATNILPHNISEIIDALIHYIKNPEITTEELLKEGVIKGPDLPTAGYLIKDDNFMEFYKKGQGSFKVKGHAEVNENYGKGKSAVIITEIPFQLNKVTLIEKVVDLVKNGKIKDISDVRDESDRDGIRIVIEVKKGGDPNIVLKQLYKLTNLETSFACKFLAIVDGVPKVLNLKEYLSNFITFRKDVVVRRTRYDLKKAQEKLHILEGLKIALDNIDDIVALIKASKSANEAREGLVNNYSLSERQAQAILDMKLQKLTNMEMSKIREDYENTLKLIEQLNYILENESEQYRVIREELQEIKDTYGDERKTKITYESGDYRVEDLIKDEDFVVMITENDYIKKVPLESYRAQKRGGKGSNAYLKDKDIIKNLFIANSKDYLLIITDDGSISWLKTYEVPNISTQSKGRPIVNYVDLKGRKVMNVIGAGDLTKGYLIFMTRKGIIKKTELKNFSRPRAGGIRAIKLDDGDRLSNVLLSDGSSDIIVSSDAGYAVRFRQDELSVLGRVAKGVKAIRLKQGEQVIGFELVRPGHTILTVTQKGYGKRTLASDYPTIRRGGRGVIDIKTEERNGNVVGIKSVTEDDEVMLISKKGKLIRTNIKDIRLIGRNTKGVRVVNLEDDDEIVSLEKIQQDEEDNR